MAGGKDREENTKHISAKQPLLLSKILESWGEGRRWGRNESEGTGYEKGVWLSVCQAGQWTVFSRELRRTLIQQDPWDGHDLSEVGSVQVGPSEQVSTEGAEQTEWQSNRFSLGHSKAHVARLVLSWSSQREMSRKQRLCMWAAGSPQARATVHQSCRRCRWSLLCPLPARNG